MRGLGSVCRYPPGAGRGGPTHGGGVAGQRRTAGGSRATGSVQDRVQHLENLVLGMMQQAHPGQPALELRHKDSSRPGGQVLEQTTDSNDAGVKDAMLSDFTSPSASDYGSATVSTAGVRYVNSAHWAAVLEGIADLKDHLGHIDQDGEDSGALNISGGFDQLTHQIGGPHLLSGCPFATKEGILASMPPRIVVDRLISKYFNSFDMSPGTYHPVTLGLFSGQL